MEGDYNKTAGNLPDAGGFGLTCRCASRVEKLGGFQILWERLVVREEG